jgi:DNA helicase-2/ATP-dependent DNA helicase PcrA
MCEEILQGLNQAQREAVITTEGPVMVMAGAGSGKTRVLTRRIAHLILDKNVYPSQILAVTFTNKAAREMKERVGKLINEDTNYMWISTFHSFCARFLRMEIEHIAPYTNKYQIIDDDDSEKIVRDIIKDLGYDIKDYKPKTFLKYISDEKNEVNPKFNDREVEDIFVRVNEIYNKTLVEQNLVDFDDLIILTLRILNECPDVREKYQEKFHYILVDEFQDTNYVQYKLIKALGGKYNNIFVVGDEDQSIYSFRGARVENVQKFRQELENTKLILLEENYRSTKSILNIANKVIKNNPSRIDKNLFT